MKALAEENCTLGQSLESLREALVAAGQQRGGGAPPVARKRPDGRMEFNDCGPDKVAKFRTRWPRTPSPD